MGQYCPGVRLLMLELALLLFRPLAAADEGDEGEKDEEDNAGEDAGEGSGTAAV